METKKLIFTGLIRIKIETVNNVTWLFGNLYLYNQHVTWLFGNLYQNNQHVTPSLICCQACSSVWIPIIA